VAWAVSGLGIGIAYPASTVLALNAAGGHRSGEASASLQVSETLGTGISGALFALGMQLNWSMSTGVLLAFVIAAAVIVVAFIPASHAGADQVLSEPR
jgi:MFS family permease